VWHISTKEHIFAKIFNQIKMTGSDFIEFDKALNLGLKLIKTNENPNLGLLIVTGINLGLRIENLLQFTYADLRSDSVTIVEGKTGKKRKVIINDNIRKALTLFEKEYCGYAFKSQKKTIYSPQHVNRLLKKYFKGKISTHSLRKSFGRRVWENDNQSERSLIYLSELFQHSSISITRIYLGIRQEELDNIYINL
jgi:integrase